MKNDLAYTINNNIKTSSLTIYDEIAPGDPYYWYPSEELEEVLNNHMTGLSVEDMPNRTRSKFLKTEICKGLGYEAPNSFKKTQPRFLCQNFDVYGQKSSNLQIWNEGITPTRRYVLIKISKDDFIEKVKVVDGTEIEKMDNTGKLTQKYQASLKTPHIQKNNLLSLQDTKHFENVAGEYTILTSEDYVNPSAYPTANKLLRIDEIFKLLEGIVGTKIPYLGTGQERNNGANLHKIVCEKLGYTTFKDDGKFPDVKHQLLEVKLQTSSTIDLGLFSPNDNNILDIPKINDLNLRMCDARYAIFYGDINKEEKYIEITNFYLSTGEDFFNHFRQFEGKKINKKIQMIIPNSFW